MFLSQAKFGAPSSSDNSVAEIVDWYLDSLRKNGQVYGDYLHASCGGVYTAYARLARPDAAELEFHSKYGLEELQKIRQVFGALPKWEVLADNVPSDFHNFQTSSFLFLFSSAFDVESPICCGDTGERLPTYLIPLDYDDRERLYFWSREYSRMDGIWFESGDLEIPAYEQMASPHSTLAKQGRELGQKVEKALGVPTYYFLMRYYGRSDGEEDRRCPGCNGEWRIKDPLQRVPGLLDFHFRCEPCRLISHIADAEYDEEWAHIGEFDSAPKGGHDRPAT